MLGGCGALRQAQDDTQPPIGAPGGVALRAGNARADTSTNGHLYVADSGSGIIYRYALIDGLPQTSPDKRFADVPQVRNLGVDRKGNIYATNSVNGVGVVRKFSPNGKLVGKARLGTSIVAFAVGAGGFFYASSGNDQAFTYAPSAFHHRGIAAPVAVLTATGGSNGPIVFISMAEDASGRLYASAQAGINVYYHPHRTSSQNFTIGLPRQKWARRWDPWYGGAVAFGEASLLYANVQYHVYCSGGPKRCQNYWWHLTDFDAISGLGHKREDRWILAENCYTSVGGPPGRLSGNVTGMAVFDGYIEAACTNTPYGSSTAVWVYKADAFGVHQPAVETLSGLDAPTDVKVGP
jgi:hypothetical protein